MRKLAWAALGFAAAAGLAEYVLPAGGLPYLAAALAVLSPAALLIRKKRPRRRVMLCALAGALGLLSWWGYYTVHIRPAEARVGETVRLEAVITDYVERHPDYERVQARVEVPDGLAEKALLYLYEGSLPALAPGDRVEAEVRLTSAVIRRGERSHTYTSQGFAVLGYIQPDTLTVTGRDSMLWRYFPQRLSQGVKDLCARLFPAETASFMKALLTGDTAENTALYTSMRLSGVMHIVAVSGMHLFVLVAFVQLMLGRSRRTNLLCLPVIALFTLMAGCRPSVVRAAVMQGLYLLAPVLGRESDGPTCLGAAALALLAVNPMAIGGVGMQLSFACMAGLVLLLPGLLVWMERHLPMDKRLVRAGAANLACTLGATAFSTPLAAVYFGQVPLLSPLANLLTLFVVEAVFAAGYVICALGAVFPALGTAAGMLLAWPVRYCLAVYRAIASLPLASLPAHSAPAALWLISLYALGGVWYVLRRRKKPLPLRIPVALAAAGLALVLAAGKLAIPRNGGVLTVLDVDQGACAVLASRNGTMVVDCGGSALASAGDRAADRLLSLGRTRVDMLVLTHLHADHANGAETLLYRTRVDRLILPGGADDADGLLQPILEAAAARGTQVEYLAEDADRRAGDLTAHLLLPQGSEENEQGIVVLAELCGKRAYLMGDAGQRAERSLLAEGLVPDGDILVAGHHGSKTASGALFLLAARPETAIVSVGYNSYGQPAEETMARLEKYCPSVLRTDRDGDVTIYLKAEERAHGG